MKVTFNYDEGYAEIQPETKDEYDLSIICVASEYDSLPPKRDIVLHKGKLAFPWTTVRKTLYTKRQ